MAKTFQEPGPTNTSTAEKCSSRQTGSASCNVNMLKYHCCWMQHCKWVCMLKFEQTSSKVRLSGSQQGFWKFEVAMGHQHPHSWALLGWHQCSPRPKVALSTLSMHYWPHWMSHRITHAEPWLAVLHLYTETTNWECTGFPTLTKCHFRNIQQHPWMKWPQVLLSSSQLLELCPALSCASTPVHAL